jgi:hypothetical protein
MSKAEVEPVDVPVVEVNDELDITTWFRDGNADVEPVESKAIAESIATDLLGRTDIADILRPLATVPAQDLIGQTLHVQGYRRMPSQKEDSRLRFYYAIDAYDAFGEHLTITCGSLNVMARLTALAANGYLPMYVAIVETRAEQGKINQILDLEGRSADDAKKEAGRKITGDL